MRIRLLSMSIVVFLLVLVIGGTAPSFAQNAKATCDPASIIKKAYSPKHHPVDADRQCRRLPCPVRPAGNDRAIGVASG